MLLEPEIGKVLFSSNKWMDDGFCGCRQEWSVGSFVRSSFSSDVKVGMSNEGKALCYTLHVGPLSSLTVFIAYPIPITRVEGTYLGAPEGT